MDTNTALTNFVMLKEQSELIEYARSLELIGIADALEEQFSNPNIFNSMSYEDRFSKCLESEDLIKKAEKFKKLYKESKIRRCIYLNQLQTSASHGLTKEHLAMLAQTAYITNSINVIITGPVGVGKTALAIGAAMAAMKNGYSARFYRVADLMAMLETKTLNAFMRFRNSLDKIKLLILDDYGSAMLSEIGAGRLNEIMVSRYNESSTIFTTQLKKSSLKDVFPQNSSIGPAFADRAFRECDVEICLQGDSWRGKALEVRGSREC